jgi:hypothetical protein
MKAFYQKMKDEIHSTPKVVKIDNGKSKGAKKMSIIMNMRTIRELPEPVDDDSSKIVSSIHL